MKLFQYNKGPRLDSERGSFSFSENVITGEGTLREARGLAGRNAAIIADSYVMRAFAPAVKGDLKQIVFKGECCPSEFYRIKRIIDTDKIRSIIGMGGGKLLDLCKFLKKETKNLKLVAVPTSAATCSAATPVTVVNDENGKYMNTLDTIMPDCVIIDYDIFYGLPMAFFAAGIVDTLAKYYEMRIFNRYSQDKGVYDVFVFDFMRSVYRDLKKIIRKWGSIKNSDRRKIADINILYSGFVSCIGQFTITASAAHAVAAALTGYGRAREFLHGEHVGLGLLVQETLFKNKKNAAEIENILGTLEMPVSFSGMGISKKEIRGICDAYGKIKAREKIYIPIDDSLMYNILQVYL